MKRIIKIGFVYLVTAIAVLSCTEPKVEEAIGLEIPAINSKDYIVNHTAYTICYNSKNKIPDWVAYELTQEELGDVKRKGKSFQEDDTVDQPQADNNDYKGSGYTRGHMAPSADFSSTEQLMWETFYFTNCCPQTEKLNNGDWQTLEKEVRSWAKEFGKIYVVTGPIIIGEGLGTIGENKVVIPDAFFKVLLIEQENDYHSIGFVMANNNDKQPMAKSAASINEIEEITGFDFFPQLDDAIEEDVEQQYDLKFWGLVKDSKKKK